MADPEKFWNKIAQRYAKSKISNPEAYQQKLDQTRNLLHKDSLVLEYGCGTGSTALYHSATVDQILALDISEKMIEIARLKAQHQGIENVVFERGSLDTYPLNSKTYDMVMAHSVLHLLPDRTSALEKSCEVLKPGGYFISSTACLGGVMPWLRIILPLGRSFGLLPDVKFFKPEELLQDIRKAGFIILDHWQPKKTQGLFVVAQKPLED